MNDIGVFWARRDFRLEDNPALSAACDENDSVVICYIHAPSEEGEWRPGAASNWWLHHSLCAYQDTLGVHSQSLIIRQGNTIDELRAICKTSGARNVYWNRLYDPATIERDTRVKEALKETGVYATSFNGCLLREPWEVAKDGGSMYRVYTPFSKKYFSLPTIKTPLPTVRLRRPPKSPGDSVTIDDLGLLPSISWDRQFYARWQPGEIQAGKQLGWFLDQAISEYKQDRDIPACEGVSRLSPSLHFGEISPRQIWHAVHTHGAMPGSEESIKPYLRQLIWRDFAHHLLYHLPHTTDQPFNPAFEYFEWQSNPAFLQAWQQGKTGVPLVDAGMRQLWQTGWMHNRVRMLTASLLTKNGLVHWLEGAKWFWDTLLDASLANNTMGWQWTAGCGVDAAPYFRIFNPTRQGKRFDVDGEYVRQWVPELGKLPSKYIHSPSSAPVTVLAEANIIPGKDYPLPVVNLSTSGAEALTRYKTMRGQ